MFFTRTKHVLLYSDTSCDRTIFNSYMLDIHKRCFNPLTPNDLQRRRAVSPLKFNIPRKNMREKQTNSTIIYSVY
jgi:hypothetical protein